MSTSPLGDALPTSSQMRNLTNAAEAAWHARQLREASRAFITGNFVLGICLLGTLLVVVHDDSVPGAPFVMCGLLAAYLVEMILAFRCMSRQRAQGIVTVISRREQEVRSAAVRPWRVATTFFVLFTLQAVMVGVWSIALPRMTTQTILVVLAGLPVLGVASFVRRYVEFRLWEDLLFAASVALAYVPFVFQAWALAPLSFLALLMAAVAMLCLHRRWMRWTRSMADEAETPGVRP